MAVPALEALSEGKVVPAVVMAAEVLGMPEMVALVGPAVVAVAVAVAREATLVQQ
jgi:hypothetical protein